MRANEQPTELMLFLGDNRGEVAEAWVRNGYDCISWHPTHHEDVNVMVLPPSEGTLYILGGGFDDAMDTARFFKKETGAHMLSVHAVSADADELLPLLGTFSNLTDDEPETLIVHYTRAV
jgi:hypothetical protein